LPRCGKRGVSGEEETLRFYVYRRENEFCRDPVLGRTALRNQAERPVPVAQVKPAGIATPLISGFYTVLFLVYCRIINQGKTNLLNGLGVCNIIGGTGMMIVFG